MARLAGPVDVGLNSDNLHKVLNTKIINSITREVLNMAGSLQM
jgi:hypothetical protein